MVKNLPAMQETQVRSLGQEDPLEGGHGNSLQFSCLKNPMDRGAWQTTILIFGTTEMVLEDIMPSDISQRQMLNEFTDMWNLKKS